MRGLVGKRIVIAGGANGIGRATAQRLVEEGASVAIGDIDGAALDVAVSHLNGIRTDAAEGSVFDLADAGSVAALIDRFAARDGGIDGLVNVAVDVASSHIEVEQTIADMDPAVWARTFQVNTIGYALTIKAALPHLALNGGSIVNVSSTAAHAAVPFVPAYSASKAGVHAITRHVALNFAREGVRCNCVAPGWTMTKSSRRAATPDLQARIVKTIPLGRVGYPEDMAAAIAFLMSEDASWITGQLLPVNGGTTLTV